MSASQKLAITQNMTIYQALDQKAAMLAALAEGDALELDLSQVAEIDTAGLQLLLLVKREANLANKRMVLSAHSPVVRELIEFTHLAAYFGDPMVITAGESA